MDYRQKVAFLAGRFNIRSQLRRLIPEASVPHSPSHTDGHAHIYAHITTTPFARHITGNKDKGWETGRILYTLSLYFSLSLFLRHTLRFTHSPHKANPRPGSRHVCAHKRTTQIRQRSHLASSASAPSSSTQPAYSPSSWPRSNSPSNGAPPSCCRTTTSPRSSPCSC